MGGSVLLLDWGEAPEDRDHIILLLGQWETNIYKAAP